MAKELQEAGQWKVGEKVLVIYSRNSMASSFISEITRIRQHYGKIEINVKGSNNPHAFSFEIDGCSKSSGYNCPHMVKYTEAEADKIRCDNIRRILTNVDWSKVPDQTIKEIWKLYKSVQEKPPEKPPGE